MAACAVHMSCDLNNSGSGLEEVGAIQFHRFPRGRVIRPLSCDEVVVTLCGRTLENNAILAYPTVYFLSNTSIHLKAAVTE